MRAPVSSSNSETCAPSRENGTPASLASGVHQDFATASNALLRLRVVHPVIAILGACYIIFFAIRVLRQQRDESVHAAASRVLTVTILQIAAGAVNLSLLAPVWMQIIHLCIADVLWIALVLLALETATIRVNETKLVYA